MEYYFAYGSNLSISQMEERECNVLGDPVKGFLKGYRLGFTVKSIKWGGGVADVAKSQSNESVKGVLYRLEYIESMDRYEACTYGDKARSKYYRSLFPIQTDRGEISAWVYYVVEEKRDAQFVHPTWEYVKQIINGNGENDGGLKGFEFSEEDIQEVCQIARINDLKVLKFIKREPHKVSIKNISEGVSVDIGTAKEIVKKLTGEGLIKQDTRDSVPSLDKNTTYYTREDKRREIERLIKSL